MGNTESYEENDILNLFVLILCSVLGWGVFLVMDSFTWGMLAAFFGMSFALGIFQQYESSISNWLKEDKLLGFKPRKLAFAIFYTNGFAIGIGFGWTFGLAMFVGA